MPLTGADRKPIPIGTTGAQENRPRFSPDGRWIAYESDESGRMEVYVQAFPPAGGKWQISPSGGFHPVWRRDGRELFFLASNKMLMAAAVDARPGAAFNMEVPRQLFQVKVGDGAEATAFDVSRDGTRFLVAERLPAGPAKAITVVLNWPALLKR